MMLLWRPVWFGGIVLVNVALLVVTFFRYDFQHAGALGPFWQLFNLSSENNVAAWWSGMLLFFVALHSFDGFCLYRTERPAASRGWLALSLVFLALSADEIASFHERMHRFIGLGFWWSLLPFAVVLAALFLGGLYLVSSDRDQRGRAAGLFLGCLVLGFVALQERWEHTLNWGDWRALRGVLEEGTELVGMSILLLTCMANTRGIFRPREPAVAPVFEGVVRLRMPITLLATFLAPALALGTASLDDLQRGHPADWLAACLCMMAAIAVTGGFLRDGKGVGLPAVGLSAICLLGSAGAVAVPAMRLVTFPGSGVAVSIRPLFFLALFAFGFFFCALGRDTRPGWALPTGIALLLTVSALHPVLFLEFLLPSIFGLVFFYRLSCPEFGQEAAPRS